MAISTRPDQTERILDAAQTRLIQGGYRGLNLDELASELGMSKKTLYQVFASKEALVSAVVLRLQDRIDRQVDAILEQDADPIDRLRESVAFVTRALSTLSGPVLADIKRHVPDLGCSMDEFRQEQLDRVQAVIAEGVAEGLFRPEIDPYVATRMLLGAIKTLMESDRVASGELSVGQVLDMALAILLEGVRVPVV